MANPVEKLERNIDYTIVTSTVVAALVVGALFYAMRKSGVTILKQVAA
jgi:hypothetical protein